MKRQRRIERFERVRALHQQGQSIRGIARDLGMSRRAVKQYLRRESCPDWKGGRTRTSGLKAYDAFIDRWFEAGGTNLADLHRELVQQGCRLSAHTVRRYVNKRLATAWERRSPSHAAAKAREPRLPSAKQLSFHWVVRPEQREAEAQARLGAILNHSADLASALELADEFACLIRKQSTSTLTDWLKKADSCECDELRRFAEGLRREEASIQAAVSEPWSNGPVEGHVNRLKTIKRQMYGRAGFRLLRARVLQAS
jgi:transposase